MAGYSRQSAASIVPTAVVRATPLNDEFNTLRDAFVVATGHKHDGTSTEGAYVPLISDTNSRNKVVVDSANNRISLFINVSSAAVEQLRLIDGAILPVTDNDIDLGSSSFEFKDLFIDGTANIDSLVADTAAISGGTINSAVIGGTTPAAGTFTTITATVSATIPSVAITGGTINNTIIGATTPAAGTFTNLTVNTAATIASAAISAGTINNTVIGGTTPQAVTGTTITANTGFVGALTGNVTGNVTASSGTSTFNNATVNGTLSATLTGNVNASSGTSTFNNVTISGTLNMDGATAATITNLSTPVNTGDAATKGYVDTAISNLIDTAPGTLDTLNELAAALGDDPNFATTVTNSIATKLSLSGGTMTGAIAMGTNKITGMGDPTNAQDAATKTYVDTQRDTRLALSGGTMSGAIAMGTNKITGLGDPTSNQDAATKIYVDGILGSATSAAASAAAAATSASNAATSASNASTSATNAASSASAAAASAAAAAASYDSFDDRYLGVKTSDPSLDNDGNALVTGAIYFNSTAGEMRVWTGSAWASTLLTTGAQTFTGVKTFASNPILDAGTANGVAYLNGSKVLTTGSALTFNGTSLLQATGASAAVFRVGSTVSSGRAATINLGNSTSAVRATIALDAGTELMTVGPEGAFPLVFQYNGSEAMRLDSTGLGIGTSSPTSKLTVAGAISVNTGAANLNALYLLSGNSGNRIGLSMGRTAQEAYIGIASTSNSIINGDVAGDLDILTTTGNIRFSTNAGASLQATLDSSGNLGLGVTPSAWTVFKAIQINAQGSVMATSASMQMGNNIYYDGAYKFIGTGYANRYYQATGEHVWTVSTASGTAGGTVTETQAMTLNASGNFGVGTSSPTDSNGFSRALDLNGPSGAAYYARTNGSSTNYTYFANYGADGYINNVGAGSLLFFNNGSERARIDSSGNLGIGTSSPATKLDVNGDVTQRNGAGVIIGTITNNAGWYDFSGSTNVSGAQISTAAATPIRFLPNGTERARITSGGNLLVGTTTDPAYSGYTTLVLNSNTNGGLLDIQLSGSRIGSLQAGSSTELRLYAGASVATTLYGGGTERARITSTGTFQLTNNYQEGVLTANTGTAYTIDLVNGTLQILTLTGNCTFTFPTATAGQSFTMLLRQDGTGGRTVTWPAAVRWPGNTAPTITSTASQTDKYIFTADGTRWYGSNAGQAYVA